MPRRERYLRTSEVALRLQVSPKTVSRWAKEGRLPYLATLGGHRRFPATTIERLVGDLSSLDETIQQVTTAMSPPAVGTASKHPRSTGIRTNP